MLRQAAKLDQIAVPAAGLQAGGFPANAVVVAGGCGLRMRVVDPVTAIAVFLAHAEAGAVLAAAARGRLCRIRAEGQ